tara:strand:- start:146 stop:490 length:345 start_codon:yes stop_codon:yes gene_type:complete
MADKKVKGTISKTEQEDLLKKIEGPFKGGIQPTASQTKMLRDLKKHLDKTNALSERYSVAEQKMIEDKLAEPVKKADGGMVLKQATDDRNGTPNKSVCRGGGAAIKGIKFSGVK